MIIIAATVRIGRMTDGYRTCLHLLRLQLRLQDSVTDRDSWLLNHSRGIRQ